MNVLVTGGTGFLGGRTALRLAELGHTVTVLGRNAEVGATLKRQGIRFMPGDLRLAEQVKVACSGQHTVIHCGALSSPWGRYEDFYACNVLGTRNVAEACLEQRVERLVHVSTPSIYFGRGDRLNVDERASLPRRQRNAYSATKLLAEQEVRRASEQGLPTVTIRPRAIFGPGDRAILPRIIAAAVRGRVPLIDGGRAISDITYVDNVVDALLLCMNAPDRALGQAYNITNGEPKELRRLLETLFGELGMPFPARPVPYGVAYAAAWSLETTARLFTPNQEPPITRYAVHVLGRSQTLNIDAARDLLGYVPRIGIDEGLAAFAAWWKERERRGE